MTVKDIITHYCKERNITKTYLAQMLGVTKERLYTALSRENGMNMRVSTLLDWLEKMDYEVEIEPINGGEGLVLDGEDDSFLFEND